MEREEEKPVCPHGHSDEIIPCFYGFPDLETYKEMKKNETAHWMGCVCNWRLVGKDLMPDGTEVPRYESTDPKWYCKIHKITF